MKTKKRFFLLAFSTLFFVNVYNLNAQVTIGNEQMPRTGTILDLKKTDTDGYLGGVLLPHVEIKDLRYIPASFTDASKMQTYNAASGVDTNEELAGMVVYNTVAVANIPTGLYVWRGKDWMNLSNNQINGGGHVVSGSTTDCGAYLDNGRWLAFMCYNLGADTSLDPFTPAAGLHGGKYRFGVVNASLSMEDDQSDAEIISDWTDKNTTAFPFQPEGDWSVGNNPCPDGWRIPTNTEWLQVIDNNSISRTTNTWTEDADNFDSGLYFGNALFLPAGGGRNNGNGKSYARGQGGRYWSSTQDNGRAYRFSFDSFVENTNLPQYRSWAYSLRCVAVE